MATVLVHEFIRAVETGILFYFVALNGFYAILLLLSVPQIWMHWKTYKADDIDHYLSADALPGISVVVPAYNMAESILETTSCLLALKYARHEVIIVNDGSKDATMATLRRHFQLYEVPQMHDASIKTAPVMAYYRSRTERKLLVIDKANGGKSDALNAGLCAAGNPLCLFVDADTLIENDALVRLARRFVLDPNVAGAGATIRIANGCKIRHYTVEEIGFPREFLPSVQVPEYLRAFLFGRLGFNGLGGNLIISGAFGIFRRDYVLAIGGYKTGLVAEDLDLVVRLHKYLRENRIPYSMPFIPDPVAWTEVPSDVATLGTQRERWHRGLISSLTGNLSMLFRPRYGRIGMIAFPYFLFGEMLAPVVEAVGILITLLGLAVGALDLPFALTFFAAAWGYGMLITLSAVLMDELTFTSYRRNGDFSRMVLFAILEPFGYRQMTVLWRLRSFPRALLGHEAWGEMKRRGFRQVEA